MKADIIRALDELAESAQCASESLKAGEMGEYAFDLFEVQTCFDELMNLVRKAPEPALDGGDEG